MAEGSAQRITLPADTPGWSKIKSTLNELAKTDNKIKVIYEQLAKLYSITEMATNTKFSSVIDLGKTHFACFKHVYDVSPKERKDMFKSTLIPTIAQLALESEILAPPGGLKVSQQKENSDMRLERRFVASLLALGFLCLVGDRPRSHVLPNFSFRRLYAQIAAPAHEAEKPGNVAKLEMILNYFLRVSQEKDGGPKGKIRYTRLLVDRDAELTREDLRESNSRLVPFFVDDTNCIEDAASIFLQVDFANKYLGGGVLGNGKVQEEIRFCLCPELLSSMLFMEYMLPNEAIIISGFEQFSKYKGYRKGLVFDGDHRDDCLRDPKGNIQTSLVAIDAVPYRFMKGHNSTEKQFLPEYYMVELNKAHVGFSQSHTGLDDQSYTPDHIDPSWLFDLDPSCKKPIATGNWGCGAFGGDHQFKVMLQWLAASYAYCPAIMFYSFKEPRVSQLRDVIDKFNKEEWTVAKLFESITTYAEIRTSAKGSQSVPDYFDWVLGKKSSSRPKTDMGDFSRQSREQSDLGLI